MKLDAQAVTEWANRDYPSYRRFADEHKLNALPCDPEYPEHLKQLADEARRRK